MRDEQATQEDIDELVSQARESWNESVLNSGIGEAMYIASGEGSHFLYLYEQAKEEAERLGLFMPNLVEGLTINIDIEYTTQSETPAKKSELLKTGESVCLLGKVFNMRFEKKPLKTARYGAPGRIRTCDPRLRRPHAKAI